jgi:hypothetical protein
MTWEPAIAASTVVVLCWGFYRVGKRHGIDDERARVNYGMNIALSYLSSKALYLLNGWNRGDMPEDELRAGLKAYAAVKKAKHDAEEQAFLERLGRHGKGRNALAGDGGS